MFGLRTVSQALEKMNVGYRRKALQLFQGELQRPVHHAVKQETVLARIDVGNNGATVRTHKVERGWRDNPDRILKRSQYVKRQAELVGRRSLVHGYAYRVHVGGALAVRNLIFQRSALPVPVSDRLRTDRLRTESRRPQPLRRRPLEIFVDWLF